MKKELTTVPGWALRRFIESELKRLQSSRLSLIDKAIGKRQLGYSNDNLRDVPSTVENARKFLKKRIDNAKYQLEEAERELRNFEFVLKDIDEAYQDLQRVDDIGFSSELDYVVAGAKQTTTKKELEAMMKELAKDK